MQTVFLYSNQTAGAVNLYEQSGLIHDLGGLTLNMGGDPTVTGALQCKRFFWRLESNAPADTQAQVAIMTTQIVGSPFYTIKTRMTPFDEDTGVVWGGLCTADALGNFDVVLTDAQGNAGGWATHGTKRPAMIHTWNGVLGTTSIFGGVGIATMNIIDVP